MNHYNNSSVIPTLEIKEQNKRKKDKPGHKKIKKSESIIKRNSSSSTSKNRILTESKARLKGFKYNGSEGKNV